MADSRVPSPLPGRASGLIPVLALAVLSACDSTRDLLSDGEVIASVDRQGISVEAAAELLGPFEQFANGEESVRSVAELWADYTLLAQAVREDPTLSGLDLSELRDLQMGESRVLQLREAVIQVDTALTDEELYEAFVAEDAGLEVRARHILIVPPEGASPADLDSTRAYAERIRARALSGEDFAQLAVAFSADPSAPDGGELGFFGRGRMVPAFEEVAFSLEPGEVSELVQSEFGLHIIKVEEHRRPEYEDVRDEFRTLYQQRAQVEAEADYILEVEETAGIELAPNAAELLDRLLEDPWSALDPVEAEDVLVEWTGGRTTLSELRDFLVLQPREVVNEIRSWDAFRREGLIRNFPRRELLLIEADRLEIEPQEAEWDLSSQVLLRQAASNAQSLGLYPIEPSDGESFEEAMQAAVRRAIGGNLSGEIGLLPLGAVIGVLRAERDVELYPERFPEVVARVEAIRSAEGFEPFRRESPGGVPPEADPATDGAPSDAPPSGPPPTASGDPQNG